MLCSYAAVPRCETGTAYGDSALWGNRRDPLAPQHLARRRLRLCVHTCATPGRLRYRSNVEHAVSRPRQKIAQRGDLPPKSRAILRSARTRRRRSTPVSLHANRLCWRKCRTHRGTTCEPSAELCDRRAFRNVSDFAQKVIGQRHPSQSRPRLQLAMEVVRDVAQLDHGWHVPSIQACAGHVQHMSVTNRWSCFAGRASRRARSGAATMMWCRRAKPKC